MFGMMVITNAGAALVRQAASGSKKLVFTRAKSGSQWDDSRADLANKPADWYDGTEGTISGVTAGSDGLKVVASFAAADSGDLPVKAVCVCAQLKKDGVDPEYAEADDIIFAATCNDNSCFTIADSFSVNFDLPIPMSSVVDDTGSTSGDYVTLDTEQTITGEKTIDGKLMIGESGEGEVVVMNDDLVNTLGYGLSIKTSDESSAILIIDSAFVINPGDDERSYSYATMPLKCEYNTTSGTVDLTLGNGHKIRLTCTSVVEDPT